MLKPGKQAAAVSTLLAVSLVSAACSTGGSSNQADANKPKAAESPAAVASAKPKLPLFEKPVELTYFVMLDPKISATKKNYSEIEAFSLLEKETNVKIKFLHPPLGSEKEQFNLMVSSNDLADLLAVQATYYNGGAQKALNDGVIIRLNELIDKHAPNFKKYLNDHPDFIKDMVLDDGTIYAFPTFKVEKINRFTNGFQIRKDWLDKYGLQVPNTMDEWYKVLKTFKEKDPQSTPFSATAASVTWREFMSAWAIKYDFYQVNGKVKFGQLQPEYKEYLTTMKKWYDEGLLDPEFATNDTKKLDSKITGNIAGSFNAQLNGGMGRLLDLMKDEPGFKLVGAPNPQAKDGKFYNLNSNTLSAPQGNEVVMISGSSKKAAEAVQWMDVAYSEWGHNLMNFGIEGKSYNMVNGAPKLSDAVMKDPKLSVVNALGQYSLGNATGRFWVEDSRLAEQVATYPEQLEANKVWASADSSLNLPNSLTPTVEESQKLASIMADINTYNSEMFLKFVYGKEPLSNFDAYQQRLKQMNIEEAIKIQQAALDRYNKRK
ncbi:ABC transporter substrate-binding protein [Paenibacillus sp. FSL H8-0034]|uniref:ABC transporter substrate-binding protein n=1 Tax=Paenibacillus sp. FSL H8-0034 TaxID=2954671 RepID=UPI0030FAD4BB